MINRISISADDIWAGSGLLRDGAIEDCAAVLGDTPEQTEMIYEAIENAIAAGQAEVTLDGVTYTWEVEEAA